MHRLLFALAALGLVGCSHSHATGPKWPEPSATSDDGGESIEPHPSATFAAAVESSADAEETVPVAAAASTAASAMPSEATPASASVPTPSTGEDVFTTEDIIIEIDE